MNKYLTDNAELHKMNAEQLEKAGFNCVVCKYADNSKKVFDFDYWDIYKEQIIKMDNVTITYV